MSANYSFEELLDFLAYASDMGLLKANTAGAFRTAASKIADDLTEQESEDVRTIDLDLLFQRFVNRNKVKVAPDTLRVYKRRLGKAIDEFTRWREDPTIYKPGVGSRKASPKKASGAGKEPGTDDRPGSGHVKRTTLSEPPTKALTLPFPLRSDFLATIQVPRDLKQSEADRLSAFIRTLAIDDGERNE